jgi:hypothetical protein
LDQLRDIDSGERLDEEDSDEGDFDGEDDYVDSDNDNVYASSNSSSSSIKNDNTNTSDGSRTNVIQSDGTLLSGDSTSIKNPSNFSRVDMSMSSEDLALNFPLYYDLFKGDNDGDSNDGGDRDKKHDINDDNTIVSSSSTNVRASSSSSSSSKGEKRRNDKISENSKSNMNNESVKSLYKDRCLEVTLKAGEMLYLPAGWFHEVKSTGGGKEGHLAFNYWFHPPDGTTFEKPYSSDFWPNDWKKRNLR